MRSLLARLGVDRAVLLTITARLWTVCGGLLTIVFVTTRLTPVLQGYYYTFYSLVALQIFAELGLIFVMVQLASHEVAHLHWDGQGCLQGDEASKRRLQSLLRFGLVWFGAAAVLMVAVLIPAGLFLLARAPGAQADASAVVTPWCLLVVFAAFNLLITALVALLEGCGKIAEVASLRLAQSVANVLPLWLVLSLGGQLYALPASSLCVTIVGATWLWLRHRKLFADLLRHQSGLPPLNWKTEIWPFQWRIAVSWMCGYLSFQIFNPLLFATHGPVAAGQMGMSLQIIGALNGAAMAWISTKVPLYGRLVAQRQFTALDALFFKGLRQSLIVLVGGLAVGLGVLFVLGRVQPEYAVRILPFPLMLLLSATAIANHIVGSEGTFLRAFKQDPFMPLSVLSGVATVTLAAFLIPPWGVAGAAGAYGAVALLVGLLGGTALFLKKRREYMYD